LPDCIIIATALIENAELLITNDTRFDKAKEFLNVYNSQEFFERYLKKEKR